MTAKSDVPTKTGETRPALREPFRMLEAMEQEMSRVWREGWPFGPWLTALPRRLLETPPMSTAWAPRMDVYEKDGSLIVEIDLPGMRKEDLDLTIDDGNLVIKGERRSESEVKEEDYYRSERSYGTFYRRAPLPEGADPEKIAATYVDGILKVRVPLPAKPEVAARKVEIG